MRRTTNPERAAQEADATRRIALLQLLEQADQGNASYAQFDEAGADAYRLFSCKSPEWRRWTKANGLLKEQNEYPKVLECSATWKAQRDGAMASGSTNEQLSTLYRLLRFLQQPAWTRERLAQDTGLTQETVSQDLVQVVRAEYERLLTLCTDRGGLVELVAFISSGNTYLRECTPIAERLTRPSGWNGLVALHYEAPDMETFHDLPRRTIGEVRIDAAEALRTECLTSAQIALARCNCDANCRIAVGDVLTAELAKLVVRLEFAIDSIRKKIEGSGGQLTLGCSPPPSLTLPIC